MTVVLRSFLAHLVGALVGRVAGLAPAVVTLSLGVWCLGCQDRSGRDGGSLPPGGKSIDACEKSVSEVLDVRGCFQEHEDCGIAQPGAFAVLPGLRSSLTGGETGPCQSGDAPDGGKGLIFEGKQIDGGLVVYRGFFTMAPLLTSGATIMCGGCSGVLRFTDGGTWEHVQGLTAGEQAPVFLATPDPCQLVGVLGSCLNRVTEACALPRAYLLPLLVDEGRGLVTMPVVCDGGVTLVPAHGLVTAPRHILYVGIENVDGDNMSFKLGAIGNPALFPPNMAVSVPCGFCAGVVSRDATGWRRLDE